MKKIYVHDDTKKDIVRRREKEIKSFIEIALEMGVSKSMARKLYLDGKKRLHYEAGQVS